MPPLPLNCLRTWIKNDCLCPLEQYVTVTHLHALEMPVRKMGVFSLILLEVCKNSFSNKIDIYPVSYHDTKIMIVE